MSYKNNRWYGESHVVINTPSDITIVEDYGIEYDILDEYTILYRNSKLGLGEFDNNVYVNNTKIDVELVDTFDTLTSYCVVMQSHVREHNLLEYLYLTNDGEAVVHTLHEKGVDIELEYKLDSEYESDLKEAFKLKRLTLRRCLDELDSYLKSKHAIGTKIMVSKPYDYENIIVTVGSHRKLGKFLDDRDVQEGYNYEILEKGIQYFIDSDNETGNSYLRRLDNLDIITG